MASYIDETLIEGETVAYRGQLSLWGFFWPIVFGFLLSARATAAIKSLHRTAVKKLPGS